MTSKLIVNSLAADTGVSTITFADQAKMGNSLFHSTGFTIGDSFLHSTGVNLTNINATGVITATKFVGEVSVGSSITFEDNEKAYFGTGTDFSIYHNGSASYLDETGTGGLIAKTNTAFQVFNSAGSQAAFTATPGGSVQLYHNTTERLATTNAGVSVSGNVVVGTVTLDGGGLSIQDADKIKCGNQDDLKIYHDGSNAYFLNDTGDVLFKHDNDTLIAMQDDGEVQLYNDGTQRLRTTGTGVYVTGIVNGATQLNLSSTGGDLINLTSTNAASRSTIKFNTNGNDWEIGARGSTADNPNNFYIFDSASTSYRLLIDSDGAAFFKGVSAGAKGTINLESQDPFIRLYDTNGEANKRKWDIRNIGQSGYNELDFRTINDANNSFNSVMQIEHGGDVNISDGNLRVASGHGIDFSATGDGSGSMQNELLDDYEEGLWTPLVRNSSGTGTAGSANYGYYTKVGNVVHAHATVHWTALNSGTTNTYALVVGFPFATKNATNYRCQHILGAQVVGVQAGGAGYNLSLAFDGNLSAAYLLGVNSASTGGSNYTHTPTLNSSGTIYGLSITYLTD